MTFFHSIANAHRKRNLMARVKINGAWFTKENIIKEEVDRAFQILLSTTSDQGPNISGLSFERFDAQEVAGLKKPSSEEEVYDAHLGFNGDKALDSDRFSMAFWQFSWEFVNDKVISFFKEFHEHDRFVRSLNAIFLVLIPK